MSLFDAIGDKLGAIFKRAHLFQFKKPAAKGALPLFTRDLRPIGDSVITAGNLVELWCVLDDHPALTAASRVRFDILEEDFLLTDGPDDQVISLLGTNAVPPKTGFITEQRTTVFHELAEGVDVPTYLEEYRRTRTGQPHAPYDTTILVLVERGVEDGRPSGTRRSHVITWWRTRQVADLDSESELYFAIDIDGALRAGSPVLRVVPAAPGVAVRILGNLVDAAPFTAATPEPLPDLPVSLGGRRALSGAHGEFVIDARLAAGDHRLQVRRPGIDTLELTVRVRLDAAGHATVTLLDPAGTSLFGATTTGPATEETVVTIALGSAQKVRVHKLRGTVLWPDSRPGGQETVGNPNAYVPMPATHLGTPLAERHVYVLPLPPGGALTPHRPRTTRAWEALKSRPEVLRSARPGAPLLKERTLFDGRFEVKYVDLSANSRFLLWVERFAPQSAQDATTEAPDHVVRTEQHLLIELHENDLGISGNAGRILTRNRNLVDRERNLSRDVVSWGVDAIRVVDIGGAPTLVRPDRALRATFDDGVIGAGVGEQHAVTASRLVDLVVQVLPLAPVDEPANEQGAAARRLRAALDGAASAAFPAGADLSEVRLVLDVARLDRAVNLNGAGWDAPSLPARQVELLERTLIVRPGHELGLARWHIDAVALADAALVTMDVADPIGTRHLVATVVPVLGAVTPRLPALAGRRLYLGPGHGLWPIPAEQGSADPADWQSNRGGWQLNAGEDEVDVLQSAGIKRIVERCGMLVAQSRELDDFARPGVANPGANQWVPQGGAFPRLWQQNAIYYLGGVRHSVVTGDAEFRSPAQLGSNKNNQGIKGRLAHVVAEAAARPMDLILFPHTNAGGGHGTLMMYLNIQAAPNNPAEGNPLGLSFATKLRDRVVARCRIPTSGSGVMTMRVVNAAESDSDLVHTNDHWELRVPADRPVLRLRVRARPAEIPAGANAGAANPPPADSTWNRNPFARTVPVVVSELLFHDHGEDARLLGRAWFRRLATEAMSQAIEDQVRDNAAAVTADQVRAVLAGIFGATVPVAALAGGAGPVTAAAVTAAITAVGAAAPPGAAAGTSLANLVDASLISARSFTRQHLVDSIVTEVRTIAGYGAGDNVASTAAAVLYGDPAAVLTRAGEPATRAEAGALACLAVGLAPASLATAETQGLGAANQPLVRRAGGRSSAYFPRAEGLELARMLHALRPEDIYKVADVFLADAGWRRSSRSGQPNRYELDPGTPAMVIVETDGFPWRGTPADVSFELAGGGKRCALACSSRGTRRLVSRTWFVDWPPAANPVAVTVTVRVRHGVAGWRPLGVRSLELRVVDPAARATP